MKALMTILCALAALCSVVLADTLQTINAWSGREMQLPFEAKQNWTIESEHGRTVIPLQSSGTIKATFPPLAGKETLILSVDGEKRARIALHPQRLLAEIVAECRCHRDELEAFGVIHKSASEEEAPECIFANASELRDAKDTSAKTIVLFTDKRDFPMPIAAEWQEIRFGIHKSKGTLGIVMEGSQQQLDYTNGSIAWLVATQENGAKIVLLPPEFDLDDIDNILFLKKTLLNKQ